MISLAIRAILIQLCYHEKTVKQAFYHLAIHQIFQIFFLVQPRVGTYTQQRFESVLSFFSAGLNEYFDKERIHFYFTIFSNISLVFMISTLIILNWQFKINLFDYSQTRNLNLKILIFLSQISFYIRYLLIQPLTCMILLNIVNGYKQQNIFYILNCTLFGILVNGISFLQYIFHDCQLYVTSLRIKKIQLTFFDFVIYLLQFAQPLIYVLTSKEDELEIQSIIYCFIGILQLNGIFNQLLYYKFEQIKVILFFSSFGMIISVCNIFSIQNPMVYLILFTPILYNFTNQYWDQKLQVMLFKNPEQLKMEEYNFILCFIFSEPQQLPHLQKLICNCIYHSMHKSRCKSLHCGCRKIIHSNDPLLSNVLTENAFNEIKINYLNELNRRKSHIYEEDFNILCHFISSLQKQGLYQEVYQIIEHNSRKRLNYINEIKWTVFTFIIKYSVYNSFSEKLQVVNKEQVQLSLKIGEFIKTESFNTKIKQNLAQLIKLKIQFLTHLQMKTTSQVLFTQMTEIRVQMKKKEIRLRKIYSAFPINRNRSMLMFFYAEIMNDWQKAYDQINLNDSKENKTKEKYDFNFNFIANQMSYLIFSFENKKLKLQNYSRQANEVFGYNLKEFEMVVKPDELIPYGIAQNHDEMIQQFLTAGRGKYFRQKGTNVAKLKNGFLQPIFFFYDIFYDNEHCFRFINFCSKIEYVQALIQLDGNHRIQGISKDLLRLMNFPNKLIEQCNIGKMIYNLPVQLFISDIEPNHSTRNYLYFPNQVTFCQLHISNYTQKVQLCKNRNNMNCYEIQTDIDQCNNYTIIRIFRLLETDLSFKSQSKIESSRQIDWVFNVQEDDIIMAPYYYDESNNGCPDPFDSQQYVGESRRKHTHLLTYPMEALELNPEISHSPLENSEDLTIKMLGDVYQFKTVESQILNQNEIRSSTSTMLGIKKSQFNKKYLLFNLLNNQNLYGKNIAIIITLLIICLLLQVIFTTFIIISMRSDYQKLEYYYQSVQINHYFIEPLQKFFLMRLTWQNYLYMRSTKQITYDQYYQAHPFLEQNLNKTYLNIKLNFQEHLSDQNFLEFVEDKYTIIKQQVTHINPVKLQEYNLTQYYAFNMLLEAINKQYHAYLNMQTDEGVHPYNTLQYANYLSYIQQFDEISDQIYQEAKINVQLIVKRWEYAQIGALLLIFAVQCFTIKYLIKYINQIKNLMALKYYVQDQNLHNEIRRLNFLVQNLSSSSNMHYKYRFNLEAKEQFIIQNQRQYTDLKKQNKKIKISSIWIFILMIVLFFQHTVTILLPGLLGARFINQFPQSVELLKIFSDLGVYIPAAYSQKQILFFWSSFTYMNDTDKQQFQNQIRKGINKFQDYLQFVNTKDGNDYQYSDDFMSYFYDFEQSDICSQLDEGEYFNFTEICTNGKQGLLKRGLRPVLTAYSYELTETLNSEYKVSPILDLECVYFTSEALSQLNQKMFGDIIHQIQDQQQLLDILNGGAMIVSFLVIFLLIFYLKKWLIHKIHVMKQISQVFPQETIFLNDNFERELRFISVQESYL